MKRTMKNVVAVVAVVTLTTQSVTVEATSSLNSQKNNINQQIKDAEQQVEVAKQEKSAVMAEIDAAEAEVAKANQELDAINAQVSQVKWDLAEAEKAYDEATVKRDNQYESLKDRVSYMYEYGDVGYTQVLLEAESVGDFFKRVEYVNSIIKHDKEILASLEETQQQIDDEIQVISQKKLEAETLQAQQKAKTSELEQKQANKERALAKINEDIEAQQDIIYSLEKENEQIEAMIRAAQSSSSSSGKSGAYTYTGGQLGWPAPEYKYMSSDYEHRVNPISGRDEWHTGIDLPTPYGSAINAAEAGVVITAGYVNGYGYTVIIDHGGGLSTLYGHNSSLEVSVGDTVTRGQRIANAGSTGNSTGNHCHFEVRVNGKHTDPKPYLGM